jgi:hypothetical protein
MFRTIAAAMFALLVTAPAHAATILNLDLNFGNGYQEIGNIGFDPNFGNGYIVQPPLRGNDLAAAWVYFDGLRLPPTPPLCCLGVIPSPGFTDQLSGGPPVDVFRLGFPSDRLPVTFSDFTLNGVTAVSGDVSVVPIPDALPMFASVLFPLAGFAAWRSRRQQQRAGG